jgi:hypothetical protein
MARLVAGDARMRRRGEPMFALLGPRSKSADLMLLDAAQAMERAGRSEQEIFRLTNWFRDLGGGWTYEASDAATRLRSEAAAFLADKKRRVVRATAEDVLAGYAGFEAYPELRRVGVQLTRRKGPPHGEADLEAGTIAIWADNPNDARLKMLGELQKFVQRKEGFAEGGTPASALQVVRRMTADVDAQAGAILEKLAALEGLGARLKNLFGRNDVRNELADQLANLRAMREQLDSLTMWEAYRRLGGTQASRNVERRADLTAQQRADLFPPSTEDIPRTHQILTRGARRQFSTDEHEAEWHAELARRAHVAEVAREAREARPAAPVRGRRGEQLAREDALGRAVDRDMKAIAAYERTLLTPDNTFGEIAEALNKRFPQYAPFDAISIAKRSVWWRIDEASKRPRRAWTPELDAALKSAEIAGLTSAKAAERLNEMFPGARLYGQPVVRRRQELGLPTKVARVEWTEAEVAAMMALKDAGVSEQDIATRLTAEFGRPISKLAVRGRHRQLVYQGLAPASRGRTQWTGELIGALTSAEVAALAPSEAATLLSKRFDMRITRHMISSKRSRLAAEADDLEGAARVGEAAETVMACKA